jgi:hypothetical protein
MIRQSCDTEYRAHLYALMNYAVGGSYHQGKATGLGLRGDIPTYPLIPPRWQAVGQSRRMLNNQSLMMMKVGYHDPEPDFPDLPEVDEEVRRTWVKTRWRGYDDYSGAEWGYECIRAFLDGDGVGIGAVQIDAIDGRTIVRNHSPLNVLWDRHAGSVHRARHATIVHYISEEEAVDMFGSKAQGHAIDRQDHSSLSYLPSVRLLEYVDMGIGKSEPTRAFILDSIDGKVMDIDENGLECIPISFYTHWHPYIQQYPSGRLDAQVSNQEMRNSLERYIKMSLERGSGYDLINTVGLNEDDLVDLLDGILSPVVKYDGDPEAMMASKVQRVDARDIPSGVFNFLSLLDRYQNTEGGNSDADQANLSQSSRTLGEIQQLQAGADIQTAWSQRQYARFLQDVIQKAVKVGSKLETQQVQLDINGVNVTFNDPQNMNSELARFLREYSRVIVSEDKFLYKSNEARRKASLEMWMAMKDDPYSNPLEVRREIYRAMDVRNPDKFIAQEPAPQQPGNPMPI